MKYLPPPPGLPPGSTVCCYLRDSGGDSQEDSVDQQKRVIEAYCNEHGLILVKVFADKARTGGTVRKRNEFLEMVKFVEGETPPDGLLLWNYARFSRNEDDAPYFREKIRYVGVVIHSLNDNIQKGKFQRFHEAMIDYSNADLREKISIDVKRKLAQKVEDGYRSGGIPARGYVAVREETGLKRDGTPRYGSKMEPDPELGPLVTLAFKMRADGRSLAEIMDATGGKLYKSKGCFTSMFTNRTYLGIGLCGGLEVENHHPALVDLATWNAVQEVRDKAKRRASGNLLHPKRVNSPSLLSGMAVCVHCGTPVIREVSGKAKWQAYLCGQKRNRGSWRACEGKQINAVKADKAVLDTVLNRILTPEFFEELLEDVRSQVSNTAEFDSQEERANQNLVECNRAINRLLDVVEKTDSPTALERLKERENEKARLQFELAALQARREAACLKVSPEALQVTLQAWAGEVEQARDDKDIRALQVLLRRFVTKVELGYNVAKIWYTYPVDALGDFTLAERAPLGALFNYVIGQ